MKSLQDLDIFVRTVDSGSLSATARALDLTPAAASAALKRLEAELGVALFVRSTRSLRLTQQGALFLEHCRPALAALHQVRGQLQGGRASAFEGTLQLAAPSDLGRNVLLPWLDAFQAEHPGVDIRLQLSDRVANVYSEPVDAAFRYGKPQDSGLVALPLAPDHRRVLCAAPAYVQAHGAPDAPQALADHACLCFMLGSDVHDRWRFWDAAGQEVLVRVRSRNVANDGDAVRRWAVLGRGIAYKSYFDVADDLAAGRLVPLCPGFETEAVPLYLVAPSRHQITPLVRALRDFMAERLQSLASAAPGPARVG
ncbi:LysR family transcriptional regulator [Acidovorax sp. Leaf76]|uniref:LysR family transcriptional regulator n=1 Tax=unclassified Acidovorax TaxID=2684926 RepID=UPI0006F947EA|nr:MULTISPECIES: LysR family transcriptional regulator [unclassified Acidovorax]KQO26263.1 LysR family transcriptional regulator [Acidovorax sp. Leaf76]KQS38282.1 LysR family transcriptional regulator [Acidovorax sp. Leaf191]